MRWPVLLLAVCAVCASSARGESSVPFITPCHASDAACLAASAQAAVPVLAAGLPRIGLRRLDPMHLPHVRADQAGLTLEFRDTAVKGLRNCQVLSLKRQGKKQSVELKCSVVLVGEYSIGGRLLVLPVEGNGKYKIKIRDIVVNVQYETEETVVEGRKYWKMSHWHYSSDLQGGAEFQFQNLFNGNKQLSDSVHEFANSSWKEIFQEVAPPIVKAIVANIVEEISKFFNKTPLSDLALD